ncbi:MAG: lysophospholipid acyltransferase family protein [Vicinamibacterales bacterium]|nr:lysophospholipid acyltransferase family protein [Vicinamibacterales bacterium]
MRHRLEYLLVRMVQGLIRPLPIAALRAIGGPLGLLAYALDRRHRRIAIDNLVTAFPTRSARECRRIARHVFRHIGRLLLEVLKLEGMPASGLLALIESDGDDHVREAYRQGRGVLFFSGHFGYWEMFGVGHPLRVAPFSYVERPLDNPLLDALLSRFRGQTGNSSIARQGGVRRMLRELLANRAVALLIDQHLHGPDAIEVQFFGRPAATTSALAAMALRTGAVVIPFFALPLPGGRYRLIAEHPVPPPASDAPDAIREFTQRCTDVIEMYVRRHPELWLWMHRRWRVTGVASETPAAEAAPAGRPPGA